MNRMERDVIINYYWNENSGIDIPKMHYQALAEDAYDRIFSMIREGKYCGELHTSVRFGKDQVPEEDEDEGLSYSGWWKINIEEVEDE